MILYGRTPAGAVTPRLVERRDDIARFRDMLLDVARDPAMLEYLDNNQNRKGNPNENFARELMELFTLGEGNYSESDVKQAAESLLKGTGGALRDLVARFTGGEPNVDPALLEKIVADATATCET